MDALKSFNIFPGQIIAAKGINTTGNFFSVEEILKAPKLPMANDERMKTKSNENYIRLMVASGPFTGENNLQFEGLEKICKESIAKQASVLILVWLANLSYAD